MGEKRKRPKFNNAELHIKLPESQLEYIKKRAKKKNMTVSQWVRYVISEASRWTNY